MKTIIKGLMTWLGLSILMMIYLIIGLTLGNIIFPSSLMAPSANSNETGGLMLFISSALNAGIILYFIQQSRIRGWRLVAIVFLISFGIQYFMSQIETLWFNDSLDLPIMGIWAIITGGAIMNLLFSVTATWFTGSFKNSINSEEKLAIVDVPSLLKTTLLLSVIVWPVIYFLFGYMIAWQFAEVRLFYSGTTEMGSFLTIMEGNFTSGLYTFQILRGALWILIALPVLVVMRGSVIHKGVVLGLLFSFLGSSQLLLPNPYMSDMVRMAHLIETSSESFVWGFIIVWSIGKFFIISNKKTPKAVTL